MHRGHGEAERLLSEGVDLQQFDKIAASGGVGEEAARIAAANGFAGPNRFGKMFPGLAPFRPRADALRNLGRRMREPAPEDPAADLSDLPAGFTYLGQFVDHDLTFDQTQGFPRIDDPDEIEQARTPTLDLDSVYGLGPRLQPELYNPNVPIRRAKFRIGTTVPTPDVNAAMPNDLPRQGQKALIGDPRNDENLIVAQTHLAFLKFHNLVVDTVTDTGTSAPTSANFTQGEEDNVKVPFHRARRLVRWHYQWIVLNSFLPNLIDGSVLNDIRTNGRQFYDFSGAPFNGRLFMPLEFSVAAYRLGHSMVREQYNYNRVFADPAVEPNAITPATLSLLFTFTGDGGSAPIPSNWIVDWRRFFRVGRQDLLNFARKIDTRLIPQLHDLPGIPPGQPRSLAVRNLLRGSRVGLPKAQDVAAAMNVTPLPPDQVATGGDEAVLRQHGFHENTPLWYYILKEAEVEQAGRRLGQIGSRIVGEVFVGLLEGDPNSFLSKQPDWRPTLPGRKAGDFTMADLLRFVNELNPIG
jgi:hypothetical protein